MLHSRAKASIVESRPGVFHVYVRGELLADANMHSFYSPAGAFPTYQKAAAWYQKQYIQGIIIPFDQIRLCDCDPTLIPF